jgi:hypothetical protein
MPKIEYLGDAPTEWRNVRFEPGKAVSSNDEGLIEAAKSNRFFKVTGAGKSEPQPDANEDQADPEDIARIDLPEGDANDSSFVGSAGLAPDDRAPSSGGEEVLASTPSLPRRGRPPKAD